MGTDAGDADFELEVTRFVPEPFTDSRPVATPDDLDAVVRLCDGEREAVVGLTCDEGAGGALYVFVSGDRAWVHLTAGRCLEARDRAARESAETVVFPMDNGEERSVRADRTVSREQGLLALRHWLRTEQPWPGLDWVRA